MREVLHAAFCRMWNLEATRLVLNVDLDPEATIGGTIRLGEGVTNTAEIVVTARLRDLDGVSEGSFTTSTVGGDFILRGLPGGTYGLSIFRSGYARYESEVVVGAGEAVDLGEIDLLPGAKIRGQVSSLLADFPSDDAVVGVFQGTQRIAGALPDEAGSFLIEGLEPGSYTVRVLNAPLGLSPDVSLTVAAGEEISGVSLDVFPGATISGTVTDSVTGDPLARVPVIVYAPDGREAAVYTDDDGRYSMIAAPDSASISSRCLSARATPRKRSTSIPSRVPRSPPISSSRLRHS